MDNNLMTLVDALIPGDKSFPSASAVGVHGTLAIRMRELDGPDAYNRLLAAAGTGDGKATVAQLEQDQPALFTSIRMIVYLAYYEHPAVIQAIRELGFDYNDAPQPLGYQLEPFDPAIDRPDVTGHFVPTAAFDQAEDNA